MQMDHSIQLSRIKSKLVKASRVDFRREVFGASNHDYSTGKPVPLNEIQEFEREYNVSLPEDYVAFLQEFGDAQGKVIAGPFYGLFPFRLGVGAVVSGEEHYLAKQPDVNPNMSDSDWQEYTNEHFKEDEYWTLNGVLSLGTQGCSLYHGLIISGEFKGRIVNCDEECLDVYKPIFCHESNFLDWYERWLDEVISGLLVANNRYLFGYVMKGDETSLLNAFYNAESHQAKLDALNGFTIVDKVQEPTLSAVEEIIKSSEVEVKYKALTMLTKFSVETATPYLKEYISGDKLDCKAACESIFHYGLEHAALFSSEILARLSSINDIETYRFAMYVLDEIDANFSEDIARGLSHENVDIRTSSAYFLGKQKFTPDLVPYFISGLRDSEPSVVHASLQALYSSQDIRLLKPYYQVARSYVWDNNSVLINLEYRLKEIGFSSILHFKSCYENGTAEKLFKNHSRGQSILDRLRRAFS